MGVFLHTANGMDENPLPFANARRVGPYLRLKVCGNGFASILGAEHNMDHVLGVGVRHLSRLRRWPSYTLHTPALTRWANVWRAYGAAAQPSPLSHRRSRAIIQPTPQELGSSTR